jgi:hypothetical protein
MSSEVRWGGAQRLRAFMVECARQMVRECEIDAGVAVLVEGCAGFREACD